MAIDSSARQRFGERVRGCRERLGLTQAELGAKCGLQPTAVSFLETGVRMPSVDTLVNLCDALQQSADFILGRVEGEKVEGRDAESLLARFGVMREDDRECILRLAEILAARSKSPFPSAYESARGTP
jgi:transcriptional regulator with XRE-family HTH domain